VTEAQQVVQAVGPRYPTGFVPHYAWGWRVLLIIGALGGALAHTTALAAYRHWGFAGAFHCHRLLALRRR
jgi:hypothetical protein